MDHSKQDIYREIDENGISGRFADQISIKINLDSSDSVYGANPYTSSELIFEPYFGKFGLKSAEAEEIILDYVKDTFDIHIEKLTDLMTLSCIHGKPFFLQLQTSPIRFLFARKIIPGTITFRESDKLDNLGLIEEIDGDLGFVNSSVQNLGDLKRVNGSFWIWGKYPSKLRSLSKLEFVGGDLNLKKSNIVDLGNLEHVGGNLNLRNMNYLDLSGIKSIGKNLLLSKSLKGKTKIDHINIGGSVRYYKDDPSGVKL